MKTKIFSLLAFLIVGGTSSCISFFPTECSKDGLKRNEQYIVSYQNPPTTRRDIIRNTDGNGHLNYPKDANGACGNVTFTISGTGLFSFSVNPYSIDSQAAPATMTVNGSELSTAYGMPLVQFYDNNSTFMGQTTATAVAGDGTWLEAPTTDLSGVYSGYYQVEISNIGADGNPSLIGVANVNVYGNDPPPPPDPTPCPPCQPNMECMPCDGVY